VRPTTVATPGKDAECNLAPCCLLLVMVQPLFCFPGLRHTEALPTSAPPHALPLPAVRTSWGTFLSRAQDEVVYAIEQRVANWTHLPAEHAGGQPSRQAWGSRGLCRLRAQPPALPSVACRVACQLAHAFGRCPCNGKPVAPGMVLPAWLGPCRHHPYTHTLPTHPHTCPPTQRLGALCRGHASAALPKQPNRKQPPRHLAGLLLPLPSISRRDEGAEGRSLPCDPSPAWHRSACPLSCLHTPATPCPLFCALQYGAHWDDLDLDENPEGLGGGSVRVATILMYLTG